MRNKKVVGAMLLNLSGRTDDVRRMIKTGLGYTQKSDDRIPELEAAIDFGLVNPTVRYSPARGQGLSRFYTTAADP